MLSAMRTFQQVKRCSKCGQMKPRSDYFFRNKAKGHIQAACKQCFTEINKTLKARPEYRAQLAANKAREYRKNTDRYIDTGLRNTYGITRDDFEAMLNTQGGVCAICKQEETSMFRGKRRRLSVDHNHITGKVRALLCCHCNSIVGRSFENVDILYAAIAYITDHQDRQQ